MRKKLELSPYFPYHVTNRSNNREWFYIPLEEAWDIFCTVLTKAACDYGVDIHSFVLMSNHYHLIISTPLQNIDLFMRYIQTEISRGIQRKAGRINHVFGSRYKWSVLRSPVSFAYCYKYVLRNPIRAGLAERVEHYRYSSLTSLSRRSSEIPVTERLDYLSERVPREVDDRLSWLNAPVPLVLEALIGNALRRFRFQFSRGNEFRIALEELKCRYGIENIPATFSAEK